MRMYYQIQYAVMEKVLNEGLVVLNNCAAEMEDQLELHEMRNDDPTGRVFFAAIKHVVSLGVVQIELAPFMEATNEEGKVERIPMMGSVSNEKYTLPPGEWSDWELPVTGEKPIWIYRGIKWVQEISLSRLFISPPTDRQLALNQLPAPRKIHLKIQRQGGERIIEYVYAGIVEAHGIIKAGG